MNNNAERCAAIVVSVGTGKNNEARRFKGTGLSRYLNYLNFARRWATDSEETHKTMLRVKAAADNAFRYYRLNVEHGLDTMKLDEWKARGFMKTGLGKIIRRLRTPGNDKYISTVEMTKIDTATHVDHTSENTAREGTDIQNGNAQGSVHPSMDRNGVPTAQNDFEDIPKRLRPRNKTLDTIRKHTAVYLSREDVQREIEDCAKELVRIRRVRAKTDPQRWEKACYRVRYQCNVHKCPRGEKVYAGRDALKRHLLDKHQEIFQDGQGILLEDRLNACKTIIH